MTERINLEPHELRNLQRRLERMDARFRIVLAGPLLTVVAGVLLWAPLAMSEPDVPNDTVYDQLYQFEPNTPAVAAEVNANFATIFGFAVNNQDGITENTGYIADNAGRITDLQNSKLDTSGGTVTGDLAVNGRLAVGFRHKSCSYPAGASSADCSCNSDEVVISGGAYGAIPAHHDHYSLRESRPINTRTWRVACVRDDGHRRDCSGFTILCARFE